MNAFWVFVPGAVILLVGLIVFEWRNRKHVLSSAASADESTSDDTDSSVG